MYAVHLCVSLSCSIVILFHLVFYCCLDKLMNEQYGITMVMKVVQCHQSYDELRRAFHSICGNVVDAGNALWLGLAMYATAAIFLFFFALQLSLAARTADNRVMPQRDAVVELDHQPPAPTPPTDQASENRRQPQRYRLPGKTHGDWLQDAEERERRQQIAT